MRLPNDKKLAEQVPEIDLILGGHDHHYHAEYSTVWDYFINTVLEINSILKKTFVFMN